MAAPICARPATAIFLTVASATIGLASQDKLPASRPAVQDVNRLSAGQPSPLEATLLWPTLGRPAFVVPGAELPVRAQMPASDRTPVISLVSAALPRHRHLLRAGAGAPASLAGGRILPVGVPASVPPGTYDLDIRWVRRARLEGTAWRWGCCQSGSGLCTYRT